MRFGLIHRLMTHLLATLGILAIVTTASLPAWTNVLLLLGVGATAFVPESWQPSPFMRHVATVAPLSLLAIESARLLAGRSPLDTAVEFAAVLQVLRLLTRRGAAHDQQIIVLALLHFVAGTVLGGGVAYGLCFIGFLIVAPGALVLSHLRREVEGNYRQGARDRTGLPVDVPRILRSRRVIGYRFLAATCFLSIPMLAFTLVLFLVFPRVGLSLLLINHSRAGRMIGFSDRVDLGEVGVLRDDPTVALRFELHPPLDPASTRFPLRLQGTAFDTYDGHAWLRNDRNAHPTACNSIADDTYPLFRSPDSQHDRYVSFDLEPIDPPVVFLPPRSIALHVRTPTPFMLAEPPTLRCGSEDEIRYAGSDYRGLHYDAYIAADSEVLSKPLIDRDRRGYLAVPSDMPPRVAELARTWTVGATTPDAKARAIQEHLRTGFGYDLHSPSQGTPQPIDHFLFESKRGHCEFFSTTMAIMLRTVGVPSRNITGFVGGTWNRFGHYYAVRQGDAHSWVEAFIDSPSRPAWQTYDPTPTAGIQAPDPPGGVYYYARDFVEAVSQRWNTYVVGYDLRKQLGLIEDIRRQYEGPHGTFSSARGFFDFANPSIARTATLLGLAAIAYAAWRYRRRHARPSELPTSHRADDARQATAATLYRGVEAALRANGIARPAHMPPLTYAETLRKENHPLSGCVLYITRLYLATRFGGDDVTDSVRSDFRRAIGSIRAYRPGRHTTNSQALT
ncbi:MAG: DUF3488 and transglutaminase-like domain-containing protein [Polyangiaceae bacterium]